MSLAFASAVGGCMWKPELRGVVEERSCNYVYLYHFLSYVICNNQPLCSQKLKLTVITITMTRLSLNHPYEIRSTNVLKAFVTAP